MLEDRNYPEHEPLAYQNNCLQNYGRLRRSRLFVVLGSLRKGTQIRSPMLMLALLQIHLQLLTR